MIIIHRDIPDVAMTLAVLGAFAEGKTIIRNVYNWRVKETERMVAMVSIIPAADLFSYSSRIALSCSYRLRNSPNSV